MAITDILKSAIQKRFSKKGTILILDDTRDQDNYGSQALMDALEEILGAELPDYPIETILSHWFIDNASPTAFVKGLKLNSPKAEWPKFCDQFDHLAKEWEEGRGGPGSKEFLKRLSRAAVVIVNGEGSVYRMNNSAIRALFIGWYAKTKLGIPTVFMNGTVHLTLVDPYLPAIVRKTFLSFDGVAVREPFSFRNLTEHLPEVKKVMIPDSAFCISPDRQVPFTSLAALNRDLAGKPFFCLDTGPMRADYTVPAKSAIQHLVRELKALGLQAVLVAKQAPADNFLIKVAEDTDSLLFGPEHDYPQLLALQAAAKFQITGRYHNAILGTVMGCPTIPFAQMSQKMHGVCALLDDLTTMPPFDSTDIWSCWPAMVERAKYLIEHNDTLRPTIRERAQNLATEARKMGPMVKDAIAASKREPAEA